MISSVLDMRITALSGFAQATHRVISARDAGSSDLARLEWEQNRARIIHEALEGIAR